MQPILCGAAVLVGLCLAAPSSAALVLHHEYETGSGTTASDSSTDTDNPGTLKDDSAGNSDGDTPPQWDTDTPDGSDFSLSFDGEDDYVEVADANNLDFDASTSFSVSLWVKSNSATQSAGLIAKRDAGNLSSPTSQMLLAIQSGDDGGNVFQWFLRTGPSSTSHTTAQLAPTDEFDIGQWLHVAAVLERDTNTGGAGNDTASLYVDGVLLGSESADLDSFANSSILEIGTGDRMLTNSGLKHFNGRLDDARVYNHALSQTDIKTLALVPTPAALPAGLGLLAFAALRRRR